MEGFFSISLRLKPEKPSSEVLSNPESEYTGLSRFGSTSRDVAETTEAQAPNAAVYLQRSTPIHLLFSAFRPSKNFWKVFFNITRIRYPNYFSEAPFLGTSLIRGRLGEPGCFATLPPVSKILPQCLWDKECSEINLGNFVPPKQSADKSDALQSACGTNRPSKNFLEGFFSISLAFGTRAISAKQASQAKARTGPRELRSSSPKMLRIKKSGLSRFGSTSRDVAETTDAQAPNS